MTNTAGLNLERYFVKKTPISKTTSAVYIFHRLCLLVTF